MNDQAMADRPVFIIGADRSGTTLLRLMLTSHPLICIPPESLFFPDNEPVFTNGTLMRDRMDEFIASLYRDEKFTEWDLDRDRLTERLYSLHDPDYATVIRSIYLLYAEIQAPGALIWGDKNPYNLFHTGVISRHFPGARIVHIIRDVRGIYCSLKDEKIRQQWNIGEPLTGFVSRRYRQVHAVHTAMSGDPHYFGLHYEELVKQPEKMLRSVCSFLGISYDPAMLDFYRINREKELVPRHRLGWHAMTLEPVSGQRADAWRTTLTRREIREIETDNARYMEELGYVPVTGKFCRIFTERFKR